MNPFAPRTYGSLEQVTDRVYIFRNIVNSAVIMGDDAIAVVDTQVNEVLGRTPDPSHCVPAGSPQAHSLRH